MPDTRPDDVRFPRRTHRAADTQVCAPTDARPRALRTRAIAAQRQQWEPYLYIDQLRLMPQRGQPGPGLRLLTAISVATDGRPTTRFLLPVRESHAECWARMLTQLRGERLPDLRLIVADASPALRAATLRAFPRVQWQQSIPAFCARVLAQIPSGHRVGIARRLRNIYQQPDRTAATARAIGVAALLARLGDWSGAVYFASCYQDTLTFYSFPAADWQQLREQETSNELRGSIRRQLALDGRSDGWLLECHDVPAHAIRLHLVAPAPAATAAGGSPGSDVRCEDAPAPGARMPPRPTPAIAPARGAEPTDPDPTLPPGQSRVQNTAARDADGTDHGPADRHPEAPPAGSPATGLAPSPALYSGLDFVETEPTQPPAIGMEYIEVEDRYGYTALFEHERRAAALTAASGGPCAAQTPDSRPRGRLRRVADMVLGTVGIAALARPGMHQAADGGLAAAVESGGMAPAPPGPA
ncbi:MAG: hypothetical protein NFCOHLIN_00306 [Gammaproteobacteria bacterium]|nr:hypothetical protein [Gammaproteobacteria bacterium]